MKQSLAARFLFRAVVLALLVYAMLLTWWTPFTGDSFMHSVFGAAVAEGFFLTRNTK